MGLPVPKHGQEPEVPALPDSNSFQSMRTEGSKNLRCRIIGDFLWEKTENLRLPVEGEGKAHVHPLRHAAFKTVDGAQNALDGSKVDVVFRTHAEDATAARHAQFDIGDGL